MGPTVFQTNQTLVGPKNGQSRINKSNDEAALSLHQHFPLKFDEIS